MRAGVTAALLVCALALFPPAVAKATSPERIGFRVTTVDESGEAFEANVIDTITLFHQEDGVWKYWSDFILGVEMVQ